MLLFSGKKRPDYYPSQKKRKKFATQRRGNYDTNESRKKRFWRRIIALGVFTVIGLIASIQIAKARWYPAQEPVYVQCAQGVPLRVSSSSTRQYYTDENCNLIRVVVIWKSWKDSESEYILNQPKTILAEPDTLTFHRTSSLATNDAMAQKFKADYDKQRKEWEADIQQKITHYQTSWAVKANLFVNYVFDKITGSPPTTETSGIYKIPEVFILVK